MAYTPQEGVDYITDFYAVLGVEREADTDDISAAYKAHIKGYHPDRLEGLADEFAQKGKRMAQLLGRARDILLDTDKRTEYNTILDTWTGPVTKDDRPIVSISRMAQAEMGAMSMSEIVADLTAMDGRVNVHVRPQGKTIAMIEKMLDNPDSYDPSEEVEIRADYEYVLLEQDRNLALREADRVDRLGMPSLSERRYDASPDYTEQVTAEIEVRKDGYVAEMRGLAIANTAGRLALLAGESFKPSSKELVDPGTITLPVYFDLIGEQMIDIARQREEITKKRLDNFYPTYPDAELQTEAQPRLLIGIGAEEPFTWFGAQYDTENNNFGFDDVSPSISELLQAGNYKDIISAGYNVMTFAPLEQLDPNDLLEEAVNKYFAKYFPDAD